MRVLSVDDLRPVYRDALKAAYEDRRSRRGQCSRKDYAAGWVAALVRVGFYEAFDAEAWKEAHT